MLKNLNFSGKTLLWGSAVLFLCACSTFYKPLHIDGVDAPYALVRRVVMTSMPVGMRTASSNGREISSQYFLPKAKGYEDAISKDVRFSAKVIILGAQRPYQLEVYVFREHRKNVQGRVEYETVGQDLRLANRLKTEIQTRLAQRREDLNIIDDFRVF
jgi:hypothetical protein